MDYTQTEQMFLKLTLVTVLYYKVCTYILHLENMGFNFYYLFTKKYFVNISKHKCLLPVNTDLNHKLLNLVRRPNGES